MDDSISRQQAIDAFNTDVDSLIVYGTENAVTVKRYLNGVLEKIKQLPPIQPEIICCGDGCKFWNRHAGEQAGTCDILRQCTSDSFYCGNAKRKEVNHESN